MVFFESTFDNLICIFATLLIGVISYYKWKYTYWERRKLRYLEPHIPLGNIPNPLSPKINFGVLTKHFYDKIKSQNWKHGGLYFGLSPVYMVTDLEYVRNILSKDFQYFVDRGFYHNERVDPLSAHLFAVGGAKWRHLRTKLTPTFTSGKMKMMFQTLLECETGLQKKVAADCKNQKPIDIKEALACFTTDIIGSCAFGLDCKSFQDENSPFREFGKRIFTSSKYRAIKNILTENFPNLAQSIGIRRVPVDVADFFMKIVKDTIDYREKNDYTRKDFLQLLIDLKNNNTEGANLTFEEVAAQCFVFFLAGFETSSTTMTFALYELSKNQHLQDKVRKEINDVLQQHNGKITYDSLQDMKYLNQVIDETLRKYPALPFITRVCVKDYKVPDEDITIQKGTTVLLSILGIHYDKEYYPDPEKFDPERFNDKNKNSRHNFAHIPFGEGPRLCIGMRFGLMQSKVGLVSLLKAFKFTVNEKTQEPLKMKMRSLVMAAEGEIWLNAEQL